MKPRSEFREIDGKGLLHMYRFKHTQFIRGFTLIELMIVIGIVAILVALAVPAYNDYTIRSKVAECINGAAVAKIGVSEYRQTLGAWPPSMEEAGLDYTDFKTFVEDKDNTKKQWKKYLAEVPELQSAIEVLNMLNKKGKAYIVGGSVRDIVLGDKIHHLLGVTFGDRVLIHGGFDHGLAGEQRQGRILFPLL